MRQYCKIILSRQWETLGGSVRTNYSSDNSLSLSRWNQSVVWLVRVSCAKALLGLMRFGRKSCNKQGAGSVTLVSSCDNSADSLRYYRWFVRGRGYLTIYREVQQVRSEPCSAATKTVSPSPRNASSTALSAPIMQRCNSSINTAHKLGSALS